MPEPAAFSGSAKRSEKMKAVVYERYGPPDVLELKDVAMPTVKDDGVLIKVRAASVNRSDWETLVGTPSYARVGGILRPKTPILGSDIAGVVEEIGKEVTRFQPGDEVFGDILYYGAKGFAEYVAVSERAPLVSKPAGLSFEAASALPQAGVIALQAFRKKGSVEPGQSVLINGAGGGAGSFAIQIAKSLGTQVTGVDRAEKFDFMRSMGADHVIDYNAEDYTKSGKYDLILDLVAHRSIFAIRRAVAAMGKYFVVGGSTTRLIQTAVVGGLMSVLGDRHLGVLVMQPNGDDVNQLADLVLKGELKVPIDGEYDLSDVPKALARLGAGESKGKLVITM